MDIVYIVKVNDSNEELRYSLRSLKNVDHNQVFIVGYTPSWVKNIESIPTRQDGLRYNNSNNNLRAALNDPRVSEDFIFMNDDFFIMEETEIKPFYMSTMNSFIKKINSRAYLKIIEDTDELLEILEATHKSYELHIPFVFNKTKLRKLFEIIDKHNVNGLNLMTRTLYGNYYEIGGKRMDDVKIRDYETVERKKYLSTTDDSFERGRIGRYIKSKFKKSDYEI